VELTTSGCGSGASCPPDERGDLVQAAELTVLVTELHRRHPRFRRATIERLVVRVAEEYEDAPIRSYVPLLVRRQVDEQLRYAETIAVPDEAPVPLQA
jgi:hypothetical protein